MKGIVFTEFLQLVEEKFGYEVVDRVLLAVNPANDGAYTAIGTYDYQELIQLVSALSHEVGVESKDLIKAFGRYLFVKFTSSYTDKISRFDCSLDLLENVENYIHVEVKKLYPQAELPTFHYDRSSHDQLEIIYKSKRPFADLCEGLIEECISYFGESVSVVRDDLKPDGTYAKFTLSRQLVAN